MPRKMLANLDENQRTQRLCVLVVINMNMAYVFLKRKEFVKAAKSSKDAFEIDPKNSKAYYRHYLACKATGGLDQAKESLHEAVKIEPNNLNLRKEYTEFLEMKNAKEKIWYSKMSGFFASDRLRKMEIRDEEQEKLEGKIKRQCFGEEKVDKVNQREKAID